MSQTKLNYPSVYNPGNQTEEEIIANFVIRLPEFKDLYTSIKQDKMVKPPQHFLIRGQRGYGKTTLLLRLKIEIKNDKELSSWLIPVMFDEEQYSVRTLAKLWEEIIDILEDDDKSLEGLTEKIDKLYDTESPEEEIYNLLITSLKERNKKIVLLLDNFGEMIQKFSRKENQRLREVLITCNSIRLIGASSEILEFYYNYKQPFFDFFKLITLDELSRDEVILLLRKLGETYKSDVINQIIENQSGRIESLRRLTGGVPRTIVLLFQIFVDEKDGNSIKDLEAILDQVTPLYKHRLDNLSVQQQAIIDAIAQEWDAISTKEITRKVRMQSKAVSSQLNQLEKSQLIVKIQTSTKNQLYQIKERFFNIYYLMRLGKRKNRNKVIWLIKFFEIMCEEKELISRVHKHIKGMREGKIYEKHAFYLTQAYAQTHIPPELQHELISETKKYLSIKQSRFIGEISKSHFEIWNEVVEDIKNDKYKIAERKFEEDGIDARDIPYFIAEIIRIEKKEPYTAITFYEEAIYRGNITAMFNLALLYHIEYRDFKMAEKYYLMAVEKDHTDAMNNLALLYEIEYKNYKTAEKYFLMAIEKDDEEAIFNLASMYHSEIKDFNNAEKYYLLANDKGYSKALNNLALLYKNELKKIRQAEKCLFMAIEKGHLTSIFNLALLYHTDDKDFKKAEKYYLMAIDKGNSDAMYNLAYLYYNEYNDFNKSEKYYLMAIENGQESAILNLAIMYFFHKVNKSKAFELQANLLRLSKEQKAIEISILILLWHDKIEKASDLYKELLGNEEVQREVNTLIQSIFLMFLAKNQFNFVLRLFEENKFDIRDKYKPTYYATLKLLRNKYSDELKKMPPEIKETVDELLEEIKQLAIDYK